MQGRGEERALLACVGASGRPLPPLLPPHAAQAHLVVRPGEGTAGQLASIRLINFM